MSLYIVTTEDDDGMWFDDPTGWGSRDEARAAASKMPTPPAGYSHLIYECDFLEVVDPANRSTPEGTKP